MTKVNKKGELIPRRRRYRSLDRSVVKFKVEPATEVGAKPRNRSYLQGRQGR